MTVKEFLIKHGRSQTSHSGLTKLFPSLKCNDGTCMSIQASSMHHCYPEETLEGDNINKYETVEVHTDLNDSRLSIYRMYDNTYGDIPFSLLDKIVSEHGGICGED